MTADPIPTVDDWRRAKLLAEGMRSAGTAVSDESVALLARGIAVARTGGNVEAFLRRQAKR
jgi:hypothetical protein